MKTTDAATKFAKLIALASRNTSADEALTAWEHAQRIHFATDGQIPGAAEELVKARQCVDVLQDLDLDGFEGW